MRIAHLSSHLHAPGGVATYIRRLGREQRARGHCVYYFTRREPPPDHTLNAVTVRSEEDLIRKSVQLDLDIVHFHNFFEIDGQLPCPAVRTVHNHTASCPSGTRFLARTGRPCDRVPGLVNCLVGHLVDRCGSLRPHRSLRTLQRFRHEIRMSRKVLTLPVSNFLRARMVEAGCPEEQLRVIPSPAPRVDGPFQPVPTSVRPRFLFLGRLAPQKGISWLLRAFEGVSQNAELDIAGTGDLEDQARRFVERRGLSDRVTFHGWLEPTDLPPLFRGCRAVVFPSVWHEPAGLVALEAAAHGRALIASRVGGIPEYTCPDHAAFVPANDVSALTNAMSDLAGCAQRADRMGRSGWEAAQNRFSVDRFLQRMDSVYETVLAETMQTT